MITFDVGFRVDTKTLKSSLDTVRNDVQRAFSVDESSIGINKSLSQAIVQAKNFENILTKASSSRGLSFISLNSELRKAGTTATQMVSDLNAGGAAFKNTTNEALVAFSNANRQAITLNDHIKEMGRVFMQSLKFTVAQQAIHTLQMNLRESFEWMVDLDAQLTQIQIVSGKTAQQMVSVSEQIVERSRALKVAAQDYAEAAQIYYQQGLQDAEVQRRADITIKAAQAANESTKAMSDMLTAVWNTYQMQGDELENAASVAAKLGAETAIEFRDIAEAMQISATAASQMGVSYNSLASIIATVGSTTRQSASIIGNAYKTIFNNFQRLKVDGENGEVTLKAASQQLQALGINLLDVSGQVKELDEVIMQAGENWKNYSQNEQLAIAQIVGGTRQFGQFLALMNNFDTYLANLNSANSEIGAETLEAQYETALESIENKAINTAEAWKRAFSNFYDENGIKTIIDLFGDLGNAVDDTLEAFGGLEGLFRLLLALGTTKMPGMIKNLSGLAIDFKDSLTPGARQNRINQDFNQLFLAGQNYKNSQIQDVFARSGGVLTKALSDEIVAIENSNKQWESKLQISKEVASTQSTLNQIISQGSGASQIQAQMLQEEIKTRQQNVFAMKDEIDGLTSLARMKTDNIQMVYSNLSGNLPQGVNNVKLHNNKQQTLESGNRIVNTGEFLGMGEQVAQLKSLLAEYSKLADGESAPAGLGKAFEASLEAVRQKLVEVNSLIQNTPKLLNQTQEVFANLDNVSVKTLQNLISTLKQSGAAIDDLKNEFKQLGANGETNIKLTETQVQSLVRALFSLSDNFMLTGQNSGQFGVNMTELGNILQEIATKSGISSEQITKLQQALERARLTTNQFKQDNIALMGSFAQMASGIQMLTLSFSTLSNGIKNGNLNFLTLVTSFSMLLSSMQSIAAIGKNVNAMKSLANVLTNIGGKIPLIGAGAKAMGGSIAAGAATGGVALSTLLPIIAAVAAALFAITKVIEVVTKAYHNWKIEIENSTPEKRIENAEAAFARLSSTITDSQSSLQDLSSSFDELDRGYDAIQKLTKGSQEYTQAVLENNTQVQELLDKYSEILSYQDIIINDDGTMAFTEESQQRAQDFYQAQILGGQYEQLSQEKIEIQSKLDKEKEEFLDPLYSIALDTVDNLIYSALQRIEFDYEGELAEKDVEGIYKKITEKFGDVIYSSDDLSDFFNRYGWFGLDANELTFETDQNRSLGVDENNLYVISDLLRDSPLIEKIGNNLEALEEADSRDDIKNIIKGLIEEASQDSGISLFPTTYDEETKEVRTLGTADILANTFATYIDNVGLDLTALSNAVQDTTAQQEAIAEQQSQIYTANSEIIKNASQQDKNIYRNTIQPVLNTFRDEVIDTIKQEKDQMDETIKDYIKENFDADSYTEGDEEGEYWTTDEKGNKQERFTFDEVFAGQIMQESLTKTDAYFRDIILPGLSKINDKYQDLILRSLNDIGSLNTDQLRSITQNNSELQKIVKDKFGQYGDEIWQMILSAAQEQINQMPIGQTKFVKDESSSWSANQITGIDNILLGLGEYSPEAVYFKNILRDLTQTEGANVSGILDIFANQDFSSWDAVDQIIDKLRLMGFEIDKDSRNWQKFEEGVREAFVLNKDLDSLLKNLQSINNIVSDLDFEGIISKDDYETLVSYNGELAKFFNILADGSAQLIGDPLDFIREFENSRDEALRDSLKFYQQQAKELEGISGAQLGSYNEETKKWTYKTGSIRTQLDYIKKYNPDAFTDSEYEEIELGLDDNNLDLSYITRIGEVFDAIGITAETALENAKKVMFQLAQYADTAQELESLYNEGHGVIDYETFGTQQLQNITESEWEGLDPEEVQAYSDSLLEAKINSGELSEETLKDEKAMKKLADGYDEVARSVVEMNHGIEDLADGMEDWGDILKKSDDQSQEYRAAMDNIKESLSDVIGVDKDFITDDFVEENLDKIYEIADGSEEAIDYVSEQFSKELLTDLLIEADPQIDVSQASTQAQSMMSELQASIDQLGPITPGMTIDDKDFLLKAQNIVAAAHMTAEEANSFFAGIGFKAKFKTKAEPVEKMGTSTITMTRPLEPIDIPAITDDEGNEILGLNASSFETFTVPGQPYKYTDYQEVPAFTVETLDGQGGEPQIESMTALGGGNLNNYSSQNAGGPPSSGGRKGGGGGGKKSTYKKPTPKVRYTNRENQISRTQKTAEKLSQVEDQLYGKAKLAAMQKKSDLIVQQVKDYKALYDEAVAYREQDMQDLAATQLGQAVPMQIDAEGNILNQEEMDDYMREWKDRIDAIEDEGAKEAEQRAYDISEQAYTYYKEAQEKALEAMKEAVNQLGEWIQNEIEKRQYQMEIDIKVSDRQLSLLEFTLEELGSAGWITNWEDGLDNVINQVDSIMAAGESTIDSTESLIELFDKVNNGGLDWSQLDQDMKDMFPEDVWREANENGTLTNDILEAIGDNTETLLDYAGQLTEAWVSAWEKIGEAMDSYLEQLERARAPLDTLSGALDTFISIADSRGWDIGRIEEYNKLLDKQTDILEANLEASQAQYQGTQEALAAMEPVYNDYLEKFENGEITGQQFDVIQEQYYNLVDANADAADQMYSDWDAYVSNLQEKFEVMSEQIYKTWNDKLGNMWNDVLESQEGFDMYKTLQNWYLDDFDKDYGITSLTNQIEDAMDGISDPKRLAEYEAFMEELVAKQEEGYNLSQGELDILNARFQLMQAQDAYEDARNNKNTMRLTRDASGNYSYVYSSDDTSGAEQSVLDAQKNLHDAEKAFQEESESRWYEYALQIISWMKDINWEMYQNDEDYRKQIEEQWKQYTQAMNNAAADTELALTYTEQSFQDTVLGWITGCDSMKEANALYQDSTAELGSEVHQAWVDMDQKIEESASLVIGDSNSMEDAMYDLMGTVDDAMGNMMDTADDLADNMGSNMSQMIEDTASWSDSIIEDINAIIAKYKELYEAQTNVMQNHTGETKNYEWHMDGNTGQWYYGDNNGGYYKSGWMQVDGKWYFFDDQGYLDMGQDRGDGTFWVDNGHYQVDQDGAWIEGTIAEGHTPGDWQSGSDTKNWGANYSDLAGGNWSNTNSGGSSSNSSSGSSSSNQDYSQYLPFDDIPEGSDSNFNYDGDGIRIVNPSFNGSHAGGVDNAHWIGNDAEGWFFGTKDKSGRGNQGSYMDGWLKINGKYYHFDEDGWLDTDFNGQDWHDDFPDEENKSAVWRRYAKGGYTGNRGLKGVDSIPAILAPGEYVLNHDDTTKILSAVQLLRGLSSGALAAAANAITKLANGSIPQSNQPEQIPVQQDVHIEASFPNVSVASEIEDALNNLVNETIQLIGSQNSRRL